jgi:hypothetical protein
MAGWSSLVIIFSMSFLDKTGKNHHFQTAKTRPKPGIMGMMGMFFLDVAHGS